MQTDPQTIPVLSEQCFTINKTRCGSVPFIRHDRPIRRFAREGWGSLVADSARPAENEGETRQLTYGVGGREYARGFLSKGYDKIALSRSGRGTSRTQPVRPSLETLFVVG